MKYTRRYTFRDLTDSSHSTTSAALTTWVLVAMYMSIGSSGVGAVRIDILFSMFLRESSAS
jgi:hypothetical protein